MKDLHHQVTYPHGPFNFVEEFLSSIAHIQTYFNTKFRALTQLHIFFFNAYENNYPISKLTHSGTLPYYFIRPFLRLLNNNVLLQYGMNLRTMK
uniref:Uncharacterized protein n=1 Tax=Lepeophtheirus salmonis TaxID=72036 RepID=A0A0K2UER9_LEPSM